MFISYERTEEAAERLLKEHHPSRSIPIPVEEIVELKLGISIVPVMGLKTNDDVDAFLSHDFTELYIDHWQYMGATNRCRFTLAHELGHFVLHREVVAQITSLEQWKKFILGEGLGRAAYEIHADNFSGCLLMPREEVSAEYLLQRATAAEKFEKAGMKITDEQTLISFIANEIAKKFNVSEKAAEIRLSKIFLKPL